MLINYLKIAFRNLVRNFTYSIINIAGLSIGIACSILLGVWVYDEVSYDSFHSNRDRLFFIREFQMNDGAIDTRSVSFLIQDELRKMPTIFKGVTMTDQGAYHLLASGKERIKKWGYFVGPEFLNVFRFKLISGSPENVLKDPHSVVLTQSMAKSLFGDQNPIDKVVRIDNSLDAKVTGVLQDYPTNSSFKFHYLMPFELWRTSNSFANDCSSDWNCDWLNIYTELQAGVDASFASAKIKDLHNIRTGNKKDRLFLYPMTRWRLYGGFINGVEYSDTLDYVYGYTLLAILIIFIACINYTNLSTARSERRAREVGIRKASGSHRQQLITQFLCESLVVTTIAFVNALILVQLSLPLFSELVGKTLSINYSSGILWANAIMVIVVVSLLAGGYPAFYLSGFNPSRILKGTLYLVGNGNLPRRVLVIVQFSFSMLVIVGCIAVFQQMEFIRNRDIGYDNTNLVSFPDNNELQKTYAEFKHDLLTLGIASSVTKANSSITELFEQNYFTVPDVGEVEITNVIVDLDYTQTMGIKLLQGRDFQAPMASDTGRVLLNEAAIDRLGLENPIGNRTRIAGRQMEIIGVTENALQGSPFEKVQPAYTVLSPDWQNEHSPYITIRLASGKSVQDQMKQLGEVFRNYSPSHPFEYAFADDEYGDRLSEIDHLFKITTLFSFFAIFIACLGLLGLAAFTVERRTKELSVRKVLGATLSQLMIMVSQDFIKLIAMAILLSGPLSYWFFSRFLERYAYHIEMTWWIVAVTGLLTMVIAVAVVATQAYRGGLVNPAESLKHE